MPSLGSEIRCLNASAPRILPRGLHLRRAIDSIPQHLSTAINWLPRGVWLITTLGLPRIYYTSRRFESRSADPETLPFYAEPDEGITKWKETVRHLNKEWKQVSPGCALILSLSVALLQVDAILQNVVGRTMAIMNFIFSGVGLVLVLAFGIIITQSKKRKCPNEWIEASTAFNNVESVRFWALLAMPLCLLLWSMIFCAITVLTLPWNVQNNDPMSNPVTEQSSTVTSTGNMLSRIYLVTLTLMIIIPVYKAINFARNLC